MQSRTLLPLFTSSTLSLLKTRLSHLFKKPALQAPLQTADIPITILENTLWEGFCSFTCKLYYRLPMQDRGGCTSLPSISSAHSTIITSGLWPFPRAGYQSQSKHVWVRFSRSAKFDDVSFLHGKNDSNSQNRQMKGLNKATPGSCPTCLCCRTVRVSGFPTSLFPKAWCKSHYMSGGCIKGERLCLCTEARGTRQKFIRSIPPQCSTGCGPQAVLL